MTAPVLRQAQAYWSDCRALRLGHWPPPSIAADHLRQLARNAESPAVRERAAKATQPAYSNEEIVG